MKRVLFVIGLILLNFGIFNYLTNHFKSNFTYEEMLKTLLLSFVAVTVISFFISSCQYFLKLYVEKTLISFRSIYANLYFNVSVAIYFLLLVLIIAAFI
ncbi:hypothetical protein GOQ30_00380 [Flavobacterium sp. TP390]|uniref:Uncharacterized protein n=1 Tax=Flavobacterium profundi TaxID=1774945 RepID=A0A6I4IDF1_9FLAO|nr:hypothetical protein [Flavobacterium profundi]MVO07614.1 hypothetical protein [Flavobacterium profundi]